MMFYMALALCAAITAGACASRSDAVGATTGERDPQAQMGPQNLEQLMQKIGPSYSSLRDNLQRGDTAGAAKEGQQLAELFGGVEKFWTQYKKPDAIKWAGQARTYASESAGSAAAGDAAKASAAADNMGGACKQCHGTYRESDGQGGYRIKPGVLP